MQDPRKQKKGFDPAAFQAAAKAGQQQAYLQQNLDPDTKAKLEAVLNDKERLQQMLNSPQAKALMEVQAGTADAAIIDSLMAGAMVGEGTSYPDLTITDQKLTEELYGVGCRKGSDLASFINSVMADAYADGVLEATAETYGVQAALVEQPASEFTASESDSDVQYIKDKGTLVIGIVDRKAAFVAEHLNVAAQNADAGRVEGADPDTIRAVFHKAVDAVPHLSRRLVCKGDRQNIPGLHTLFLY